MGCNLSLLRSWRIFDSCWWLGACGIGRGGGEGWGLGEFNCAAARYGRAAWTGEGARPHMIGGDMSCSQICGFYLSWC